MNRGQPLLVGAERVGGEPEQRARWGQRDRRDEAIVRMRLAAVHVQAERVDDCMQSPFGSALCLAARWGWIHARPYRQEGPGTEALSRSDPDAHEPPAERDPRRRGQGAPRARAAIGRRAARRQAQVEAPAPDPHPPSQPGASEPVLACQRHQVLGPERGRETVAPGG